MRFHLYQVGDTFSPWNTPGPQRNVSMRRAWCLRDTQDEHLGALVTIHGHRRRGGSFHQQVSGGIPVADVRKFHGLWHGFLRRGLEQVHIGLRLLPSCRDETGQQWFSLTVQVAPSPLLLLVEVWILPRLAVLWLANWLVENCLNKGEGESPLPMQVEMIARVEGLPKMTQGSVGGCRQRSVTT